MLEDGRQSDGLIVTSIYSHTLLRGKRGWRTQIHVMSLIVYSLNITLITIVQNPMPWSHIQLLRDNMGNANANGQRDIDH